MTNIEYIRKARSKATSLKFIIQKLYFLFKRDAESIPNQVEHMVQHEASANQYVYVLCRKNVPTRHFLHDGNLSPTQFGDTYQIHLA